MKISYNWLKDYLPVNATSNKMMESPQKLSDILTSVGLEVENLEKYEEIKNALEGLIIGEVVTCEKHPDADKLKITSVNNGKGETLQIVCGAPNVAIGQKVIVAPVGTVLYPKNAESFKIKKAKIRGVDSNGMLCAEDEIGLGESHAGIIVLPSDAKTGIAAKDYYKPYSDWILEIGLTPNRMDAMSHLGVAKDVCAYLSHHNEAEIKIVTPFNSKFKPDSTSNKIAISIENPEGCSRYSGVSISGITVAPAPLWLQNRLKGIGVRPINNIVDITNFILHETGQPLHSFDAGKIKGNKIIVKTLPEATPFITLDGKVRKINSGDIMICNGLEEPMCFGGVFGGLESGVTESTINIFLESAWFDPAHIRKTSFSHNLRTDAAIRFEKGVDIGNTVNVLKRAALLIKEICGGQISSEIIDVYPFPRPKTEVTLKNDYLKRISGKQYSHDAVKNILKSLNFSIVSETAADIRVAVPFSNPDISIPADIVEEIMRIDGLDNIEIPDAIKMAPAVDTNAIKVAFKEKVSSWLTGNGFAEIFTNSITNSKYFDEHVLTTAVTIINSLSAELNVMRPDMMYTGLETVAYNLNRKNADLLLFEFGKTYTSSGKGKYFETECLSLYFTGNKNETYWKSRSETMDIFFVKGICDAILNTLGIKEYHYSSENHNFLKNHITVSVNDNKIAEAGSVVKSTLEKFSIKQAVFYLNINWDQLLTSVSREAISFKEIPKYPKVQRDLSIILNKKNSYQDVEKSVNFLKLKKLTGFKLFDVFESEKLGADKKSLAVTFTFSDVEKTLTDGETDAMMSKIISSLERDLNAEIRKGN